MKENSLFFLYDMFSNVLQCIYILLCNNIEEPFINKRSSISSLEIRYLFVLSQDKNGGSCPKSVVKTCLKTVGMRGRLLQILKGWLQPTQIPLCSEFPSWREFNHTNWQAFTLVFFLSSVTITISFSAGELLTCIPSKQGKKKKYDGTKKKSSSAIDWLSYAPMVARFHP